MRAVCAIDSFKGSLESLEAARLVAEELSGALPDLACSCLGVGDGGEGTTEAVVASLGGTFCTAMVQDPLGHPIEARYGMLPDGTALIEMAAASGLPLLAPDERNPLATSTYGTGQLIRDALERGARSVVLALGGSATNDAGMGALRALGVRFLDADGRELSGRGQDLEAVRAIDCTGLDPRVTEASFTALCDVDSPLVGDRGATCAFACQKGAGEREIALLERGMRSYLAILQDLLPEAAEAPGDGAAGGLGIAARLFLGARMQHGAEWVLDAVNFDSKIAGADFCVTGEGHADAQSAHGKLISAVARRCRAAGVPCIGLIGGMDEDASELVGLGITALVPAVIDCCTTEEALLHAAGNVRLAARRIASLISIGIGIDAAGNTSAAGKRTPGRPA